MLRVATIILPVAYNDGEAVPQETLRGIFKELANTFGGLTVTKAAGLWVDPADGVNYGEDMLVCSIAADWGFPWAPIALRTCASQYATLLNQKAIYIELPHTGVEFIRPGQHGPSVAAEAA